MGALKLYNCDIGFTLNGVNYDFLHVSEVTVEDPERVNLTRGSNAGDEVGIAYREGIRDPKTITINALDVPAALFNVLSTAFKNQQRFELVYVIDRNDGTKKEAKNALLSQLPQQLTLDDTMESMTVALTWVSYSIQETHK